MKVKLEIMGPAIRRFEENPSEFEVPQDSKVKDLMKTAGYTEVEAKYFTYVRNEEKIRLTSALEENDHIQAVLQVGGG